MYTPHKEFATLMIFNKKADHRHKNQPHHPMNEPKKKQRTFGRKEA